MNETIAKGGRSLLAVLAACACTVAILAMCFGARPAYAADDTLYNAGDVTLTKALEADPSIQTSGLSFSFAFEPLGDEDTNTTTAAETPAISDQTLVAESMPSNGVQLIKAKGFIPAVTQFPHAGVYVYDVYESSVPISRPAGSVPATSEAHYKMRVYVENVVSGDAYTGDLVIKGVTVERTAADIADTRWALEKVNPVPTTDTDPGGFAFTNVYSKTANLTISKAVKGDAADRKKHFSYTMSFVIPAHSQQKVPQTFVGTITSQSGAAINSASDAGHASGTTITFTVAADSQTSDTKTFELCDGEQLVLALPSGTSYTVWETGASGYAPSVIVTHATSDTATVTATASSTAGSNLTVDNSLTATIGGTSAPINVLSAQGDTVAFTNQYNATTPTGIIVTYLPYILLVGIPVIALVVWFAVRRRRIARNRA